MSRSSKGALKTLQLTENGAALVGKTTIKKASLTTQNQDENALTKKRTVSVACGTESTEASDATVNTDVSLPNKQQLDSAASVKEMLCGADPNARYWQLLAEERRKALEESLNENRELAQEVARLKEEKRVLEYLAEEGKRYAKILQECLDDGEEEEQS